MKHALKRLLLAFGLTAFCATPFAVFDPVNDDTDLFRNNPNIPAERPNVLIILDNTANWNTAFTNEKAALVSVIDALDSAFNVGWMMYPETGGGNDSIDGAYVRFAMRQMTATNKAALSSMVNALDKTADKGNNSTLSLAMHEAYLYFGGRASRASFGKVKTDFAGNTSGNPIAAPLGGNALPASPTASSLYTAAIGSECQKNYIIYISNGPANENSSALGTAEGLLTTAMGSAPAVIAINPTVNGMQGNWADEYAKFMAENDINGTLAGSQTAITYVVEVDPGTSGQGPNMTALMQSMAQNGKGKYFSVTSGGTGQAIVDALNSIFQEIQAVNSVFAASTLPVSVNVRGTNLNQLYIGVFRPDAGDKPRWLGNLKAYQLKKDLTTGAVFTADANLNPAINSTTGFITSSAVSFWTSSTLTPTNYWSFRAASANGVGGSSDSPDGDLVEKGGAAQQVRSRYFSNGVNGTPTRALYTCTQGSPLCAPGSLLSATPFNVANLDIDAASLNLDTKQVSPLTAKVVKTVSALADARAVALDNSVLPVTVNSITTNSFNKTVTLSNTRTISITALSNGAVNKTVSLTRPSNGLAQGVVAAGHGLSASQQVLVTTGTAPAYGSTRYDTSSAAATVTIVNSTTFTYPIANGAESATTGTLVTSNTTVNATAAGHGFTTGESVTVAGATPTSFNGSKSITVIDANTFSYTNSVAFGPTLSSATAVGATSTVTATSGSAFTGGTFGAGQSVTISGANATTPSYNGTFTILASPAPTSTTFAFQSSSAITTAASGTITAAQSGTTATATITAGHSFNNGDTITISGASPSGFNGAQLIGNRTATTFDYTVASGLGNATANPTIQASTGTGAIVTGTLANHGFAVTDSITIAGVTGDTTHNGAWSVASVPNTSTFTYSTVTPKAGPAGSPTVRLTSGPLAYATITGHGYGSAGASVTNFSITGATPAGYNVSNVTATVVDTDTVSYVLAAAQGTQTGTTLSATTLGTRAKATSTAHGFLGTPTVIIAGATPSAFNGSYPITVTGLDSFEYDIGTAQGDATGTITAVSSGSGTSERTNVINWVRGEDNFEDENANSSFADTRASIHGDVLHSRPAVVNYNRRCTLTAAAAALTPTPLCTSANATDPANADNDVYIYYGGNDGVFRALKGGFGSSTGDPSPGTEVWGFVAKEHFPNLRRLRINSPAISSSYKKPYFFDGPIGTYSLDANGDGKIDVTGTRDPASTTQDKVWLFLTMRRGGRFIYALDVSQPLDPAISGSGPILLWRKGCPSFSTVSAEIDAASGCDLGWGELGQTWSEPKVISINCTASPCGANDPVLMFGAGYDSLVEDPDPSTVTSATSTSVVSSSTTYTRSMGRGIYVVNARTGAIIWQASGHARTDGSSHAYKQVSGMDFSIASDIAVVLGDPTPKPFRAYVGDTGGNMWRIDFGDAAPANWTVAKLAAVGDQATAAGRRKFQFPPDVIGSTGYDVVIAGTGDREHPFDTTVVNRVYAFKDKRQTLPAFVSGSQVQAAITHAATATFNGSSVSTLLNVTNNCIQVAANCGTNGMGAPEVAVSGSTASQNDASALADASNFGWFITLASGEKQVGGTLAAGGGAVFFGTNQPSASAGGGACSPNLGVARQYAVNFENGTAFTGTTLSTTYAGGGFLPSPVLVYVGLGGTTGTGTGTSGGVPVGGTVSSGPLKIGAGAGLGGGNDPTGVVCYGASCALAPGKQLYSRLRKFWFKEID